MERMMRQAFGACNTRNVPLAGAAMRLLAWLDPVFEAKEIAW